MYSITGPLKLTVELKGEAKDAQSSKVGLYILGTKEVNGRSHWLQDSGVNAIWYDKANGDWNIGSKDKIGSDISGIYSTVDVAGPQEAKKWKYVKNGKWFPSDDILVDIFVPGT